MEGKIKIICTVNSIVGVKLPEYHFSHDWVGKGSFFYVTKEIAEAMTYDPGARYMFETGMLYIEDLEQKIELGLEPEGATEPENIIVLSENDMNRYMRHVPMAEFKEKMDTVSTEQILALAQYAIKNQIVDLNKFNYIKNRVGIDCYKAIEMEMQDKED